MIAVRYCGTFTDYSGYGQANRNFIAALTFAGVDVTTELVTQVGERAQFGWLGKLCEALKDRVVPYKIKFLHITPDLYPKYMEEGRYHIGHLFWETDRLPKDWVNPCNRMNEIWTASDQQAEMLRKSGVTVPIYAFPQPIDIAHAGIPVTPYKIANFEGVVFYSIFQWIDRKNPKALLTNYWKTFRGKTDVILVLKTYRVNYSDEEFRKLREEISHWKEELGFDDFPRVLLIRRLMRTEEIFRLHLTGNCFITTSRGEGWQIPAVEAMVMSNPVISIDKTGFADYLPKDLFYPCSTTLAKATQQPWIPWYTADMKWLDINEEELTQQMLKVYNDRHQTKTVGKKASRFIKDNFSYQAVGVRMKARLEEIERFL